jgi:chemotaxis protein CheY-P-specific phosphatase CheC/chemotaxis signal transduction protein
MSNLEIQQDEDASANLDISSKYIIFELNKEKIAIPLNYVQEVIDITKYRTLPKVSNHFIGVYNLRNDILPLISLKSLLFNEQRSKAKIDTIRCIVLKIQKDIIGLSVDKILQIIDEEQINTENLPNLVETSIDTEDILSIGMINDAPIIILDILNVIKNKLSVDINISEDARRSRLSEQTDEVSHAGLNLTQKQLDALKEIINIASGKASTAMSKLFKEKSAVGINIEDVRIKMINDIGTAKGFRVDEKTLGIKAYIQNDLEAAIFLMIPATEIGNLMANLADLEKPSYEIESIDDLSQKAISALTEIGNIIISHYCAGISDFLKIKVYHEVPQLAMDSFGALIDSEIANYSKNTDSVIFLETSIITKENTITGAILLLPKYEYIENLINLLNVESVVSILNQEADGTNPMDIQKAQAKKLKPKSGALNVKIKDTEEIVDQAKMAPVKKDIAKDKKAKKNIQEEEVFSMIQFQKDFEISQTDKVSLNINEQDLDTFRELGNIGAGNAGNALSQILNKKVLLEIPPAKLIPIANTAKEFAEKNTLLAGYAGMLKGFLESNIFLSFPVEDIENLLQMILETEKKKELTKEGDLSNAERSAIIEVFNILMGHYIAALSDFLKIKTEPPEYRFFFERSINIFKSLGIDVNRQDIKAVVVETSIKVSDGPVIRGKFIMFLNPTIVHKVIERITEIW